MHIIGIDPGKSGGVVCLDSDSYRTWHYTMPDMDDPLNDVWNRIYNFLIFNDTIAYLEDVHSIYGSSAKSNFQFGRSVGFIEGFLSAAGTAVIKVQPKVWQKEMFKGIKPIKKKGSKRNDTKAMALKALEQLRPDFIESFKITALGNKSKNVHDGLVDAALIAYYGIREER